MLLSIEFMWLIGITKRQLMCRARLVVLLASARALVFPVASLLGTPYDGKALIFGRCYHSGANGRTPPKNALVRRRESGHTSKHSSASVRLPKIGKSNS